MASSISSSEDPKVKLILSFLLPFLYPHCSLDPHAPFLFAVSGIQGSGKSTLVAQLQRALASAGYQSICISVDDFYHTASTRESLAKTTSMGNNKLLQQRGPPGTHDVTLANEVLGNLKEMSRREEGVVLVPTYNKAARNGQGDRRAKEQWVEVKRPLDVIILEGWCIGFRPLSNHQIQETVKRTEEKYKIEAGGQCHVHELKEQVGMQDQEMISAEVLLEHHVEHLLYMNERLADYCKGFMNPQSFDAMVHLDSVDLRYVYRWRQQQESKLREVDGQGMSDEEVERFGEFGSAVPD
ncbi:MAG: hypothetical protein Q9190_004480 [Brigantiaea leucoxantha]